MRIVKLALTVFLAGREVTIFFLFIYVELNVERYSNAIMIIFKHSKDLQSHLNSAMHQGVLVGFVPTMGALHEGHLSLIAQSKKKTDLTVCSIFVNAVQFNNVEDFEKYPSSVENDILLLEEAGCDILFLPSENEIYPDAASKNKQFEIGYLESILEGAFRPGHFQGVCLVVERLLNIIKPDCLFLGQKDYQQCLVIKKLISQLDRKIKVIICSILREKSGLAMSSRNLRLNEEQKNIAASLFKTLTSIKNNLGLKNFHQLKTDAIIQLEKKGFRVDYLELAKSKNLKIIEDTDKTKGVVILIAAFLNNVRLIDNVLIKD